MSLRLGLARLVCLSRFCIILLGKMKMFVYPKRKKEKKCNNEIIQLCSCNIYALNLLLGYTNKRIFKYISIFMNVSSFCTKRLDVLPVILLMEKLHVVYHHPLTVFTPIWLLIPPFSK